MSHKMTGNYPRKVFQILHGGEPLPFEVLQFIRYCRGVISLPQNLDQQTDTDLEQMWM